MAGCWILRLSNLFEAQVLGPYETLSIIADQLWTMASGLPWPLLAYMGIATTAFTLWVEINALKVWLSPNSLARDLNNQRQNITLVHQHAVGNIKRIVFSHAGCVSCLQDF